MHDFIVDTTALLKVTAWPATVLWALFILRSQIQAFLGKLSASIDRAAQVTIGKKGIEIKLDNKINAVNSRIAALNAAQEQIAETVYKAPRRKTSAKRLTEMTTTIPQALRILAETYVAVDEPDWRARVERKNELALQMGGLVISEAISRALLAQSKDETLHLALAAAVAADPEPGDLELIRRVVATTTRLHVRYKLVVAIIALINKGFVQARDVTGIRDSLEQLSQNADEPLKRIVEDARALLNAISHGELSIDR